MKTRFSKKNIVPVGLLFLLFSLLFLAWRNHIVNYTDPEGHLLQGYHADSSKPFDGSLRVVSWNLHFGEKLDDVVATLENASELQDTDLLLLQEINAEGVERIAGRLRYNYIYHPTVFSRKRQSEYGIAILSKWPLYDPEKIMLPNWLPGWVENRFAVKAVTKINGKDVTVYNTHFDLMWMEPQGEFLAKEVARRKTFSILGGDFNTWRPGSVSFLEDKLKDAGLERLTEGIGYTFESNSLKFTLDHIFSLEGLDYTAGVYRQTDASDHYPGWVDINLQEE